MSADTTRPDKAFASAQARAALLGFTLERVEDDSGSDRFILNRWSSLSRLFASTDAVEQWLDRHESRVS
jgi:hypothetical protein